MVQLTKDTVDDAEILILKAWNHVEIMDGDSGFTGMLNLTADDAIRFGQYYT